MPRIWSETASFSALASKQTLGLLKRYELFPLIAVRPDDVARLPHLLSAYAAAEVPLGLWPMLEDEAGRCDEASELCHG